MFPEKLRTHPWVFFNKFVDCLCNFIKKKTDAVFSCELYEIFKNTFFSKINFAFVLKILEISYEKTSADTHMRC